MLLGYIFVPSIRPPNLTIREISLGMIGLPMAAAASAGALRAYSEVGTGTKLWRSHEHSDKQDAS
jgi:hypothetical protein